ncbi:hypothetical protein ACFY8B_35580 [Streptomyces sp. NPDC012751]|uniref:hypothetical protein n=1 Tax=unclassified Streptomyces TaxID=2593676 RepID=UPI0004CAFF4A|nr:hypothetical protein [Streptomyces sp. NRRL S-31]AZM68332.1 transglycosylase [Streptomyces sp.]
MDSCFPDAGSSPEAADDPALAGVAALRVFTGAADRPADDPLGPLREALLRSVEAVAAAAGGHPEPDRPEGGAAPRVW